MTNKQLITKLNDYYKQDNVKVYRITPIDFGITIKIENEYNVFILRTKLFITNKTRYETLSHDINVLLRHLNKQHNFNIVKGV